MCAVFGDPSRLRILFAVAMVGSNKQLAAETQSLFHDSFDTVVNCFHGFDSRLDYASVANHVRIRKIQYYKIVVRQGLDHFFRHFKRAHLRLRNRRSARLSATAQ